MSVCARTYVCECMNPLLLNLSASLSFLTPRFFQAAMGVCVQVRVCTRCVGHIYWFPRRQVSKVRGCSNTHWAQTVWKGWYSCRSLLSDFQNTACPSILWCRTEKGSFLCSFQTNSTFSFFPSALCLSFFHCHTCHSQIACLFSPVSLLSYVSYNQEFFFINLSNDCM